MIKYFGYALITHGPRPRKELARYPAARQQILNLKHLADRLEGQNLGVSHDYAREVESLDSLPVLKNLLEQVDGKNARVVIDDYRRIFARCPQHLRSDLFTELEHYGWHFIDLKLTHHLGDLHLVQKVALLSATSPIRFQLEPIPRRQRPLQERRDQTHMASIVSQVVRTKNADKKAHELAELKKRLKKSGQPITARAIAEQANLESLETTRGNEWTASSVARALKRIDETTE